MKWNAAIIGLGQVGMGYDFDQTEVQLTHATAYSRHPSFNLVAAVDHDAGRREQFEAKFNAPAFATITDLVKYQSSNFIHCLSIAAPTKEHGSCFFELSNQKSKLPELKAILCEKPISQSLAEAKKMVAEAKVNQWLFLTNYIRRTVPEFKELKTEIQQQKWGTLQKGVVFYSKGILNSASHWIDLMLFYFGEPTEISISDPGLRRPIISGVQDYDFDFILKFKTGAVYFCACDEDLFSVGNVDLMMTKGNIRISESGFSVERFFAKHDSITPQIKTLQPDGQILKTQLNQYMKFVLDDMSDSLGSNREPTSSGESGVQTLAVVDKLIQKLN